MFKWDAFSSFSASSHLSSWFSAYPLIQSTNSSLLRTFRASSLLCGEARLSWAGCAVPTEAAARKYGSPLWKLTVKSTCMLFGKITFWCECLLAGQNNGLPLSTSESCTSSLSCKISNSGFVITVQQSHSAPLCPVVRATRMPTRSIRPTSTLYRASCSKTMLWAYISNYTTKMRSD